jgi:hypothetical protein
MEGEMVEDSAGTHKAKPVRLDSPRWLAPAMVSFFILGLIWIVTYYLAGSSVPVISDLPALANIGIGFGFISIGFFLATKWK